MAHLYDVLIVGGGPAGASAAFTLQQAGRRVLVLEKDKLPRYKTCGGAVSRHVLLQFPFSFEPVIRTGVTAISYGFGDRFTTIPLDDPSLVMVMREEFDDYFLKQTGAEVCAGMRAVAVEELGGRVQVTTANGEKLEAEHLIAADGANSTVARALGLRKRRVLAGAIEIEALVPPSVLQKFACAPVLIFGELELGYLWIFPKGDHLSVGIGALDPKRGELQAALERVMGHYGIPIAGQPRHGHPLPIYRHGGRLNTQCTLLVGDAAGLVDPFTGEGIRFAIQSGRMAAESILGRHTERYTSMIRREIGANHLIGTALTPIFYGMPRASFMMALRNPQLSRALVSMIGGRIGYARLILQVIASFPRFVLSGQTRQQGDQLIR